MQTLQTNKLHQRNFILACLALAVLLGWPSSAQCAANAGVIAHVNTSSTAYSDGYSDGQSSFLAQGDPSYYQPGNYGYSSGADLEDYNAGYAAAGGSGGGGGGSADTYTLAVTPFSGVVSTTGSFIDSMISSFGVPAIFVCLAIAGLMFAKRLAKGAFH